MSTAWEPLIRSVPVPPPRKSLLKRRRHGREAESRRRTRCRARGYARARTRARSRALPRPALSSTGHASHARPPAHACRLDKHARADAWRNQTLRSNFADGRKPFAVKIPALCRCGAIERRASSSRTGENPDHSRPGTHVLSPRPRPRAQVSASLRPCGRAELALPRRCVGCRPDGAAPPAQVLFLPQIA